VIGPADSSEFGYNCLMPFSLRARVVFPVDRAPIENGIVTIDGDRIVAVGTKADGGDVIDLGWVALVPGLVNAHTHLEFSYLQQPLGNIGVPFVDWIRLVIAERGRGEHAPKEDANRGLRECLAVGVTTIGDIKTSTLALDADVTHFHEVIAFSRARAESALNALVERLKAAAESGARATHGISPHAPYTVSPKLMRLLVSQAQQHNLPMAMHLAESREEIEFLRDGTGPFRQLLEERSMWDADAIPRGSRPLDYLRLLADAPRALVIHGTFLADDELKFLAARQERMSLVYCPRTHAHFYPTVHSPYPLSRALAAGVRVALGTDSRASNQDLNLLRELQLTALAHPEIDAQQVLRMGTLSGAEALGRDADVGSITAAKLANLVALPIPDNSRATQTDILSAILGRKWSEVLLATLASCEKPSAVYLAGCPLNR
jgi:cytosine/adenosine deaminase-related metal-dependent hydrolase